jgi:hypothetical protein
VADEAGKAAQRTSAQVAGLAQTNPPALHATIEAARAGDSGRASTR